MAVMTKMRDMTKIILYGLVAAFVGTIIFDWGMNWTGRRNHQPNAIGEVDGVEISGRDFDAAYAAQVQQFRQQAGGDVPESQRTFIKNQVWETLVRNVLLDEVVKKNDIKVPDQEIVYRLYNDPPDFLKSNPTFQNEQKQFDMAKYQAVINDPNTGSQWLAIENYLRQTLPYEKLQQDLQASVRITEEELRWEYLKRNQKAKVKYLFIDPRTFENETFEISEEDIEAYYAANQDEFREEEKRQIDYIILSATATAADSAASLAEAEDVLRRARAGADFADLAATYSEDDATREKGGDLGFFAKGDMFRFKNFEDQLLVAKKGEIIGPLRSDLGLHVIKIEDKRKEKGKKEIHARHILWKYEPSKSTVDQARDDAQFVVQEAKTGSFSEAVASLGDSVRTTGMFVQGTGFIPGVGLSQRASGFIFSNPVHTVGPVEEIPQGFLVYQIANVEKEHVKPLDEVTNLIHNKLVVQKRRDRAGELAKRIYDDIQSGQALEDVAKQDSLKPAETALFTRTGSVSGIGRDTHFIGAAFGLKKVADVTPPVEGTRGYYILQLTEKTEFDSTAYAAQRNQLAAQLMQRKESLSFSNWYADVKSKADIKDYRAQRAY